MSYRSEELLASVLAREIVGVRHVAVGAASPIPAAAALAAKVTSDGRMHVTILHSRRHNAFTDGGRELFDCAGQGRIDVFFLGGVQIDGEANINLVGTGEYPEAKRRFPGSFGSAYMYFVVPKVILFREEHSRRTLVPRVDFISAPGTSPANVYRPGGPRMLVTNLAVMPFDTERRRFRLKSVHPGHTVEEVLDQTGFAIDVAERVPETPAPDAAMLGLLRGPVAASLHAFYPEFAARVFPVEQPRAASA
ncbi:MAG: CoA synthetase [Proteobacteria bacterium]|nr:CoA synthetase [Pseudomonadota bacterium]MBI3499103.1 CoA synthetase [Pseudomonadota bacterium]